MSIFFIFCVLLYLRIIFKYKDISKSIANKNFVFIFENLRPTFSEITLTNEDTNMIKIEH